MPALNFLARLAPLVESGAKRHTVRREAKRPIKAGDPLYLFTGMRTKSCRRLIDTECTLVTPIRITEFRELIIRGWSQGPDEREAFARADGLSSYRELADWIESNYGLPFDGVVVHWRYNDIGER